MATYGVQSEQNPTTVATFAGGCFWCVQPPFDNLPGVKDVVVGYAGGTGANPTYTDYAQKGYVESIQVTYDPTVASYQQLLDTFWHTIDPTDSGGQFGDRGKQYRSVIFYHTPEQQKLATVSRDALMQSGKFKKPITTEIIPYTNFVAAEEYHQNYHIKNPIRYAYFRYRSGRDQFLQKTWGAQNTQTESARYQKPADPVLRTKLTPIQYAVTQKNGTEPAFKNEYWDNKKDGIYVDIVSGEPLFSSRD